MSLTNRFFNGAVLNFNATAVANVVGVAYKDGGQWIDVTQPSDATRIYQLATQDDLSLQLKFKGAIGLTRAATGPVSMTWADGSTSYCPGVFQVGPIEKTGDWDSPVTGTVELRNCPSS